MAAQSNILVIVPDLMMRQRVVTGLRELGYPVRPIAKPGLVAAALAGGEPVTAILVEVDGIGIDGADLVTSIVENEFRAGAPVIGFCSHMRTELMEAVRAAGADHVVSRGELIRCLDRVMAEIVGPPPQSPQESDRQRESSPSAAGDAAR